MDRYRCEKCGNAVPAQRVDRRVPGTKTMVRVQASVICERDGEEMVRESAPAPARREVSAHY